jgi:ABC-type sugar transport system substrate-binding protein
MKKVKLLFLLVALLMLATAAFAGCTSQPPAETKNETPSTQETQSVTEEPTAKAFKIGISTDAGYPARSIEVIGIKERADADPNVEYIEQNADNDSTKQIQQIKSMVDQGVDAIVVCAVDMNAILTALDYANEKGVIVTLYDRFVDHDAVQFVGGYDSYSDGVVCGEAFAKLDDGKEHVMFELVGNRADTNALARSDGFHSVLDSHTNLKIVQIDTDWDAEKALAGLQNQLQKYPDVWGIFNASSHMDGAIKTALSEVNRLEPFGKEGHVYLVSLGGEPPGLQMMLDGYTDVFMVIPFDEMGYAIYDAIMTIRDGSKPAESAYYCKTYPVTQETLDKELEGIFAYKYRDMLE